MITISTGWLVALGVSAYLIYRFWKKILKAILFLSVLSFVYVVLKVKNAYDDIVGDKDKTEIIDSKKLENKIAQTWEQTTTEYRSHIK